jgi:low affinity Fe/Cu permease
VGNTGGLGRVGPFGSRVLHAIDGFASRPLLAVVVVIADVVWVVYSVLVGFPTRLEAIFQTLVAASTLAMVFVIQHTQAREQLVTQRKLDEILRALPHADNTLIAFEEASDDELAHTHRSHRDLRSQAIDTRTGGPTT